MRYIFVLFTLILFLEANESKVCQTCHPTIFKEYYESSHRNASLVNNPIHKAMWDKEHKNSDEYSCASCHSPSDKKLLKTAILDEKSFAQKEEPISCVYCHSISNIDEHEKSNKSKVSNAHKEFYSVDRDKKGRKDIEYKTESSFFGLVKSNSGSPYHKIDYSNENYYSGNVCMGCHSHNKNEHGLDTFMLDAIIDKNDKETCISCHMPQIKGSKVTISESKTHAFHGISGIKKRSVDMGKYIKFNLHKFNSGFAIEVKNLANHALFGQMYRQGILHVEVIHENKHTKLTPYIFERVFSDNKKKVVKDTLLYAKKSISYNYILRKGDTLKVSLFVQNISQKGLDALSLDKEVVTSKLIKTEQFY